jgi:hypothetical protein
MDHAWATTFMAANGWLECCVMHGPPYAPPRDAPRSESPQKFHQIFFILVRLNAYSCEMEQRCHGKYDRCANQVWELFSWVKTHGEGGIRTPGTVASTTL